MGVRISREGSPVQVTKVEKASQESAAHTKIERKSQNHFFTKIQKPSHWILQGKTSEFSKPRKVFQMSLNTKGLNELLGSDRLMEDSIVMNSQGLTQNLSSKRNNNQWKSQDFDQNSFVNLKAQMEFLSDLSKQRQEKSLVKNSNIELTQSATEDEVLTAKKTQKVTLQEIFDQKEKLKSEDEDPNYQTQLIEMRDQS